MCCAVSVEEILPVEQDPGKSCFCFCYSKLQKGIVVVRPRGSACH